MNIPQNLKLNKRIINYSNLVNGMKVQDEEGNIGTIKDCEDIHNIYVDEVSA